MQWCKKAVSQAWLSLWFQSHKSDFGLQAKKVLVFETLWLWVRPWLYLLICSYLLQLTFWHFYYLPFLSLHFSLGYFIKCIICTFQNYILLWWHWSLVVSTVASLWKVLCANLPIIWDLSMRSLQVLSYASVGFILKQKSCRIDQQATLNCS